ncbi:zinc-binding dehydrogenase [Paraburkholderia sp. RAU2J]|uniref:zinc-binding dehydrogenase n=1 Tax=Paraburkholderia sp. RAU2J TaxID=1938810 RepID=UPI001F54012F|nr:zinc-binding dehydrogenase [Paraburkholderia sp. RAU2J]
MRTWKKIRALGADAGINYKTYPNWQDQVLELTGGKGVDMTIEVAGGEGLNQSVAATKVAGVIAQVGFLTGQTSPLNLMPLIFRQTTIRGIAVAPRSSFECMNSFLDTHRLSSSARNVRPSCISRTSLALIGGWR